MSLRNDMVHAYLSAEVEKGCIAAFHEVGIHRGARRWALLVPATRRDVYDDPEAFGTIVLKEREVYAFVEGARAARGEHSSMRIGT